MKKSLHHDARLRDTRRELLGLSRVSKSRVKGSLILNTCLNNK